MCEYTETKFLLVLLFISDCITCHPNTWQPALPLPGFACILPHFLSARSCTFPQVSPCFPEQSGVFNTAQNPECNPLGQPWWETHKPRTG